MFWISYRVSEKIKWIDTPYSAGVGLITTKDEALLLIADYLLYIIWKKSVHARGYSFFVEAGLEWDCSYIRLERKNSRASWGRRMGPYRITNLITQLT